MTETINIRNNGEHPLFLTPKVGGDRVRLELGWNEVPSGYIDRGTGGFKGKGVAMRAKGGAFAHLFNDHVKIGKRMAPVLQVGAPVPGDEVHVVTVRPGLRSHYRTRDAATRSERELAQGRQLAALEARNEMLGQQLDKVLARLEGGASEDPARSEVNLAGLEIAEVKAAIKGLDAVTLKQALGAEVAGEGRPAVVKLLTKRIKSRK